MYGSVSVGDFLSVSLPLDSVHDPHLTLVSSKLKLTPATLATANTLCVPGLNLDPNIFYS
jgi:hypothetical protein